MKNRIHLALIILWMLFIFMMSAQTGVESGQTSGRVVELLARFGVPVETKAGEVLHYLIRKALLLNIYFKYPLLQLFSRIYDEKT